MRKTEMLWFEEISALNEPVLSFPVFGRISMRQFFILGVAAMISYEIFTSTHGLVAAAPICIGAFLTLVKPKVGSSEWMSVCVILFLAGRGNIRQKTEHKIKRSKSPSASSKKLGLPDMLFAKTQEREIRTITVSDMSRPFRFRMRLTGISGQALANKRSKVYLDDSYTDSLTTDVNGELETVIIPKNPGRKKIEVYVDEQKEPAFSDVIEIIAPAQNLA